MVIGTYYKEYDRLCNQQSNRTAEILGHEFTKVDLNLLLLCMDTPVQCPASELGGLVHQNNRGISLFQKQDIEAQSEKAHDCDEVFSPAPAQVLVHYNETTNEGSE